MSDRWWPPSFTDVAKWLLKEPRQAGNELDRAIKNAFSNIYALQDKVNGIQDGSVVVTGSRKGISTGLTSVSNVVVSIDSATACNEWVNASPSLTKGAIDIVVWKPTAAGDTTPIPSVTARTVRWFARGVI